MDAFGRADRGGRFLIVRRLPFTGSGYIAAVADEAGRTGVPPMSEADDDTCARFALGEFPVLPQRALDDERPAGPLGGRYEIGRLIGSGGTARVYRSYDLRLNREVAVKIYDRDAVALDQRRRLREMSIQGSIAHPGVVALLDSGTEGGRTYLVMQLVEGENLAERLLGGPLPAAEVTELAGGLADALAHVHARRVVHRDLKPANVFLSATGPLIGDFGIAHALDTTHITGTGVVPGTAAYLAPEQVSGERAGPPADVYALGLILLESVTGRREYPGTMVEAAMARLTRPPRIPEGLPPALAYAIGRMTRREPSQRPAATEIRRLLATPPELLPPAGRRWWHRWTAPSEPPPALPDAASAGSPWHDSATPAGSAPRASAPGQAPAGTPRPEPDAGPGEGSAPRTSAAAPDPAASPGEAAADTGSRWPTAAESGEVPAESPPQMPGQAAAHTGSAAHPTLAGPKLPAELGSRQQASAPGHAPEAHSDPRWHRWGAALAAAPDPTVRYDAPTPTKTARRSGFLAAIRPAEAGEPARRRRVLAVAGVGAVAVAAASAVLFTTHDPATGPAQQPPAANAPATSASSTPPTTSGEAAPPPERTESADLSPAAVTHPNPPKPPKPERPPGNHGKGKGHGRAP